MDVGEEDIANGVRDMNIVLDMEINLEIGLPITSIEPVMRQNWIVFQEDPQPLEVFINAIKNNDVRS
jgi:hypothetical protein